MISSRSSSGRPAVAKSTTSPHHLGRVGGVVDERPGADRDLVAEHRRDLVGVAGAADVAQQRDPVGVVAHLRLEAGGLAHPRGEQARPQLRLQRLAERVVLRERERGDELGEAERRVQDGVSSRCLAVRSGSDRHHCPKHDPAPLRPFTEAAGMATQGATHGRTTRSRSGVIADQTGPLSFVGARERQRRADGHRRHQRQGRAAGPPARAAPRGRRDRRRHAAAACATKLVEEDQVDVIFGGIYSSTRQAIKGPAVVEGKTLYIYPEQYEGQESDPLIFCTGPVPAQQVDPFIPWMMRETGARRSTCRPPTTSGRTS